MPEHIAQHPVRKATFTAELTPAAGRFEVLFIREGEANGYTFSRDVLAESVQLWEQASVFVDHSLWGGRSVRDLGGVLNNVQYSDEHGGLTAELTPCGPSAEIVKEAASIMLADGAHPDLGFSADVIFSADAQGTVEKIMQPLSVDLVIDPAFATKFIRQLNQSTARGGFQPPSGVTAASAAGKGAQPMADKTPAPVVDVAQGDFQSPLRTSATRVADDTAAALRVELSNQLLNTTLQGAQLPEQAEKAIRIMYQDKPFNPAELKETMKLYSELVASATAPGEIKGPGRASGMFDSRDQLQAAVDDLVGAPREPGAETLKVAKFQGVREAYTMLTGDRDFVGGYFPDRVQFTHVSANFPGLLVNSLNKALAREWANLGRAGYDWWQKIVTVEHFNTLQDITWMLFGTVGSLPTVAENAEYTELKIGDSSETSSFIKRGGYIGLSLEAMDKDDTRKLRAIPRELANAGLREISSQVAAIFTSASGAGPTMADTGALFNATAQTTKGGHKNLLTTALGTDFTAWDAVSAAMYAQPMLIASEAGYYGTGKVMAIEPRYCLVPRALKAAAEALFIPRWASTVEAAIAAKGGPTYGGYVEPVTVPEWTDNTDWAAVADPAVMPGIMLGERFGLLPQIFLAGSETDPAMFSNDETRIKVRHFLAVGVADFRPLHKSNVAG